MQRLIKNLVLLGLTTTLPSLALVAGEECCQAGATCPVAGAAKDACCAEKTAAVTKAAAAHSKLVKVDYKVTGMTRGGCETKVKDALAKIEGVSEPSACSDAKQVKLAYDASKVKEEQLMAAINKLGFKVEAETVDLKVEGLKCGACSEKVSKKLASVKGVSEQKVCHEAQHAVVTFDPNKVSRKDIVAAIDGTGFKVVQ